MTDLSPAAQAIDHAFWDTAYDKWNIYDRHRSRLAAVLHAAVDQIETLYRKSDLDDSDGVLFAMQQLMLIADELEGVTYGTYRC